MVRYPHTVTLVTPGTVTYVKGIPQQENAGTSEVIDCEVQLDYTNYSETINGKAVTAKYKVFCADIWNTARTARTVIYEGRTYNILQPQFKQNGIIFQIG